MARKDFKKLMTSNIGYDDVDSGAPFALANSKTYKKP